MMKKMNCPSCKKVTYHHIVVLYLGKYFDVAAFICKECWRTQNFLLSAGDLLKVFNGEEVDDES